MLFQPIDDKTNCVGVYVDGNLIFDESEMPKDLSKTWGYTSSLQLQDVEYASLYANGKSMDQVCPEDLREAWEKASKKIRAYKKSFDIAKINLREHCFFELVPHDAIAEFCDVKNRITEYVLENYEKPQNYEYLVESSKLLHKMMYQDLKLDSSDCRSLFINSGLTKLIEINMD